MARDAADTCSYPPKSTRNTVRAVLAKPGPTRDCREVIAVLAPGQGAQTPGMLAPWLELAGVAEQVAGYSEIAGIDLVRLGTTADAEEIRDSAVTQPLIVAMGLVTAGQLKLAGGAGVVLAGHSIGEVTAAAVAGVLTAEQAMSFATRRGAAMAAACAAHPDLDGRGGRRRPGRGGGRHHRRRPDAGQPQRLRARSWPPARWRRSPP